MSEEEYAVRWNAASDEERADWLYKAGWTTSCAWDEWKDLPGAITASEGIFLAMDGKEVPKVVQEESTRKEMPPKASFHFRVSCLSIGCSFKARDYPLIGTDLRTVLLQHSVEKPKHLGFNTTIVESKVKKKLPS